MDMVRQSDIADIDAMNRPTFPFRLREERMGYGKVRAAARMTMANPGYNFRRSVLHEQRQARA